MKVLDRVLELKQRVEPRIRDFEWTWTNAVLFAVAFGFFSVISMAVIPSFWLYFAEQKLGWDGLSGTSDWRPLARDAVAAGLATRRRSRGAPPVVGTSFTTYSGVTQSRTQNSK